MDMTIMGLVGAWTWWLAGGNFWGARTSLWQLFESAEKTARRREGHKDFWGARTSLWQDSELAEKTAPRRDG